MSLFEPIRPPAPDEAGAAPPLHEQRGAPRSTTVLRIGKVCQSGAESACLVLNISETGMMARLTRPFAVGETVEIEMRGLPRCGAFVRWIEGLRAGLEFTFRQDIARIVQPECGQGYVARAPRFSLTAPARLRLAALDAAAHVLDISPSGVKLEAAVPAEPGQTGRVLLLGRNLHLYGTVRWNDGQRLGFHFCHALPLDVIRDCLLDAPPPT